MKIDSVIEVEELATEDDFVIMVTFDTGRILNVLIPKEEYLEEDLYPFGLNLVTQGHYV
jgi:hypothetical protein